ncbi:MAG: class I adenylate-forming enzyme family protein [Planctomycetia bacterium]|nr:class I adenylate-forming enzyme family protein [Planctomycetia bacterium]
MIIPDILRKNAELYGNEICLIESNPEVQEYNERTWRDFDLVETNKNIQGYRRELTWKQFDDMANQFANLLISRGFGRGNKVAILLMNSLEWLPLYFGILRTGALVVPLNYRYTADEIWYCLQLSEADALVFGPEFVGRIETICDSLKRAKTRLYVGAACPTFAEDCLTLIKKCSTRNPEVPLTDQDDAALYFSSGTTGFPKAILHNHESLYSSCLTEQHHHGQTRDDCFLCIPPLYHTGAKMHWFGSFLAGSRAVLLRGVKPRWILRAVSEEKVTIVWLLVPWAQDILDAIESGEVKLEDYELSQWRLMHIGAQPVPPSLIRRWKKYFPNHQYDTNYGLSESIGPGCVHLGVENIHKVGAIGKPGYGWEARIVDVDHKCVEQGQVGELIVRGAGVMTCYYHDPEATADVLRDGWLYTGDMAMEDEDGFIFLVDRKKDVIIMGGENIYPVQIEDFLRAHDKIKDVAVIGMPDSRVGEIPAAIIQVKSHCTMTQEEVMQYCESLPRYKRPRKIFFDKVPRNPTGKIEKPFLREKYCGKSLVKRQIEE